MFRLVALVLTAVFAYKLGSTKALDLTKKYIVSKSTNLGPNVGTTEYVAISQDGSISFDSDIQNATLFSYQSAQNISSAIRTAIIKTQPIKVSILLQGA